MLELACYYTSSPGGSQSSILLSVWANGHWFQYHGWSRMRTFPHCSLDIPVPWLRQILSKLCVQILFNIVRNYNYTYNHNIHGYTMKTDKITSPAFKKKSLAVSLLVSCSGQWGPQMNAGKCDNYCYSEKQTHKAGERGNYCSGAREGKYMFPFLDLNIYLLPQPADSGSDRSTHRPGKGPHRRSGS